MKTYIVADTVIFLILTGYVLWNIRWNRFMTWKLAAGLLFFWILALANLIIDFIP